MNELTGRHCVPCSGDTPPLDATAIASLATHVPAWEVDADQRLSRTFEFADFVAAIAFVNEVADIAEREDHHPDIAIHYRRVTLTIWTHAIGGLSENDFILAAHVDRVVELSA